MEESILCELLEIVTGKSWSYRTISGCAQGDWQRVIYPTDEWTEKSLEAFEMEYFNMGSEWIIHDGDSEPENPEDITGCSVYCHGWSDDEIKAEILAEFGSEGDEVVLYKFSGYHYIPTYSLAE